jgi:hypothetical protein
MSKLPQRKDSNISPSHLRPSSIHTITFKPSRTEILTHQAPKYKETRGTSPAPISKQTLRKEILMMCSRYEALFNERVQVAFQEYDTEFTAPSNRDTDPMNIEDLSPSFSPQIQQRDTHSTWYTPKEAKTDSHTRQVLSKTAKCMEQTVEYLSNYAYGLDTLMQDLKRSTSELQESVEALGLSRKS